MLTVLAAFVLKWCLAINSDKSKVMIFGRSPMQVPKQWQVGNIQISETNLYRYLGVLFSDTTSGMNTFAAHCAAVLKSATSTAIALTNAGMGSASMTTANSRTLCLTNLRPVIDYAAGVWARPVSPN